MHICTDSQIHDRGMKCVAQLKVPQFHKLFTGLNIWKFQVCTFICSDTYVNIFSTTLSLQFVEEFLNNCFMVKTVSLKDASWKPVLKDISDKFVTDIQSTA